jgi:DNA-binding NtrC family response regulator
MAALAKSISWPCAPDWSRKSTTGCIKRQYPLVEVMMLTGHVTVESAIEGMKLGLFDYLMKPSDIDLLV